MVPTVSQISLIKKNLINLIFPRWLKQWQSMAFAAKAEKALIKKNLIKAFPRWLKHWERMVATVSQIRLPIKNLVNLIFPARLKWNAACEKNGIATMGAISTRAESQNRIDQKKSGQSCFSPLAEVDGRKSRESHDVTV